MNVRVIPAIVFFFVCSSLCFLPVSLASPPPASPASSVQFSAPQYWCREWAVGPRIPLLADLDGDGHADCADVYYQGETILEMARTSSWGKTLQNQHARRDFGRDALAATAAHFTGGTRADMMAVFPDGTVRLASGMKSGETTFLTAQTVAQILPGQMPSSPRLLSADFTSDGKPNALLVGGDGRLLLLENTAKDRFTPHLVQGMLPVCRQEWATGVSDYGR